VTRAKPTTASTAWIEAKSAELKKKEVELATREQEIAQKEKSVEAREIKLSEKEKAFETREASLNSKEKDLLVREERLAATSKIVSASLKTPSFPNQQSSFKIFCDPPQSTDHGEPKVESVDIDLKVKSDASLKVRQPDFLKTQQRLYRKLHDPNISKPILSEVASATAERKRPPPPPPPVSRPPMSLPIPPAIFSINKDPKSDKENITPIVITKATDLVEESPLKRARLPNKVYSAADFLSNNIGRC
jgi:hypothetical protein